MKWVTRDHVHLDRVAAPWLIKRFIDPAAVFEFIPAGAKVPAGEGVVPFGLPGVEISAHDSAGSTFRKLLRKYAIKDSALEVMAEMIESGIADFLAKLPEYKGEVGRVTMPEGIGLEAISRGMMYLAESDIGNIERSAIIYDALYQFCHAKVIETENPSIVQLPFFERLAAVREKMRGGKR